MVAALPIESDSSKVVVPRLRFRLRTKIIAWSFIPTAIILLLVALTTYISYQNVTEEVAIQRDAELTRLSASELSAGFEEYIDRLNNLARLPEVKNGTAVSQRIAMQKFRNQLVLFDAGAYLLNNLGVVTAASKTTDMVGQDWSDRVFFRDMVVNPGLVISDIEADGPQAEEVISIAVPVLGDNNEFKGVALGMFRLDANAVSSLYGTLIRLRIGRTGNAYLIDGKGEVIYASDFSQIGKQFTDHPAAAEALGGQVGAIRTRSRQGEDIVAGYAPVPRTHWTLVVEEEWAELIRPSQGLRRTLLVLLALGVVIPSIVVMIGVRRITGPIRDFISAAQRIADGDFSQSIHVPTGDELEGLANQFNTMGAQLKESYEMLETRVAQRTQELSALNAVAEVVSRSLDLEKILPDALEEAIEVMGMEGGAIFRLDESTNKLIQVAHRNLGADMVELGDNLPIDLSIIRVVLETHQPVARLVEDYPPGRVRSALEKDGWKTVVSVPLVAQEKVLGAINATSHEINPPSAENLAVPAAIGQQIGVAIDNARLYAQTVEYARQMELARQAADAANASKSIFLANVSHELRTPLVSILGFARIVQKRLDERLFPQIPQGDPRTMKAIEQVEENLEIILTEGQRLTMLINNLLDLEKIEAGKMEWHFQPVSIGDTIRHAAAATASLFEGKPLSLVLDVPPNLPMVIGDPDKLLQVVINLISNAVKFSMEGTVMVGASYAAGEVTVRVADQGVGITLEDQVHLFEKFIQVGDAITGKPKGTGLGLAISKEIVEHHAGRIWVESAPGEGSTFSFTVPVVEEAVDVIHTS